MLALLVQILLHGELALTLYWIIQYRWDPAQGLPFAFRGELEGDLEKEWNLHPVLMITGFIYCMGQGMMHLVTVRSWLTFPPPQLCWSTDPADAAGGSGAS